MSKNKYPVKKDFLLSLLIAVVISVITLIFENNIFNSPPDGLLTPFIGLTGALLGFIITSITILFMFDYEKSEILKRIKDKGLYNQIFERFISTSIVLISALIYFSLMSIIYTFDNYRFSTKFIILGISINYVILIQSVTNILLLTFLILSLIRIARCVKLLYLILKNLDQ